MKHQKRDLSRPLRIYADGLQMIESLSVVKYEEVTNWRNADVLWLKRHFSAIRPPLRGEPVSSRQSVSPRKLSYRERPPVGHPHGSELRRRAGLVPDMLQLKHGITTVCVLFPPQKSTVR
ncbi:hypothetical protein COOONC_07698 [Cooperia oncophora]